jgi:arginase
LTLQVTRLEAADMREWTVIGVPTSAGAHHAGQDQAPRALREAALPERLAAAGVKLTDAGDLPETVFRADAGHPTARNLPAVVSVARQVADAVAAIAEAGRLPLVLGGDCTITLGAVAGLRRVQPDIGLAYVDGDADLGTPDTTDSGILDSMGIAHLLGRGAPELAGLGGATPLLDASRLAMVGADPREVTDSGRRFLAGAGVSYQEAAALAADPAGAASTALGALAGGGPVLVHFDVDVVDSGDLPLGNFPHYGSGTALDDAAACLRVLVGDPRCAGLVLTEVNPSYDADGTQLARYVDALIAIVAG